MYRFRPVFPYWAAYGYWNLSYAVSIVTYYSPFQIHTAGCHGHTPSAAECQPSRYR